MKGNDTFYKNSPNKNNIINIKKGKEISKKFEKKTLPNGMEMPPIPVIEIEKNDMRNSTAPNKNGIKYKKNFKHLKITAKNKDSKDEHPSNASIQKFNYFDILFNQKHLGKSLPKNNQCENIKNDFNRERRNNNMNIKRVISSNNIIIVSNIKGKEIFQKIKNISIKNSNKNNVKSNSNINLIKDFREQKFVNKNINQLRKHNHQGNFNEKNTQDKNINNPMNIKLINKIIYNNNKKIQSNSFNNLSNEIMVNNKINSFYNNEGKHVPFAKNKTGKFKQMQNIMVNNMLFYKARRSMSSSINIPRNQIKQLNNQELARYFAVYPDNEMLKSSSNHGKFFTILESEKASKNIIKRNIDQVKSVPKKKSNFYQYIILKGNASYLVKYCMAHRVNWRPTQRPRENVNSYNFKWKELSYGIDYNTLNRNPGTKQMVNHYENHRTISNKANMFINLMRYCEKRNLSIFKYVPFTIVFKIKDRRKIKNTEKQKKWAEKLEKLKNFIQNIDKNIKNYKDIGKYFSNEEYIKDRDKRYEFEKMKIIKLKKRKEKELEENKDKNKREIKEKEKEQEEEKYQGKFKVYSDFFPRLKLADKIQTRILDNEEKAKAKINGKIIGINTLIEIPNSHFKGKNMWVLKAVNLNRGRCIKIVNSFEQMEKVINRFKKGVDYRFSIEEMDEEKENNIQEEQQFVSEDDFLKSGYLSQKYHKIKLELFDDENEIKTIKEKYKTEENIYNAYKSININDMNDGNRKEKEKVKEKEKEEEKDEKIYNCNKILIQKYIENPLLYKGRKCDIRIWVLLTHQMKVFLFKEGHLKTCSVEFDLNSNNAFTHITNYSFQKYNSNFQKFEKGNEVPFYEFQRFIDKEYPEKKYKLKRDLMKQIKEIIALTMRSAKDKINKNGRSHQFEIFGYDFMLDCDFNVFLIEINTNPGLEISSPWIQIVVPRMLDDALRLTVDKVFEPIYDFKKNYKGEYTEEQKKLLFDSKIRVDFNAVEPEKNNKVSSGESCQNKNINTPSTSIVSKNNSNGNIHNILNIDLDFDEANKKRNEEKKENKDNFNNKEINVNNEKKEIINNFELKENINEKVTIDISNNTNNNEIKEFMINNDNKDMKDSDDYKENNKEIKDNNENEENQNQGVSENYDYDFDDNIEIEEEKEINENYGIRDKDGNIDNNTDNNANQEINEMEDNKDYVVIKENNEKNELKYYEEIKDLKGEKETIEIEENDEINENKKIEENHGIKENYEIQNKKEIKEYNGISKDKNIITKEKKDIKKHIDIKENKEFNKNKKYNNNGNNKNNIKDNKIKKQKEKDNIKNGKPKINNIKKYISPFPVPGYSLNENLWEFVCDLNAKDPFEKKEEKEKEKNINKNLYTGIRHLLKKKEKRNRGAKGNNKKGNKKRNKNVKDIKDNNVGKSPKQNNIKKEENKNNKNRINKK